MKPIFQKYVTSLQLKKLRKKATVKIRTLTVDDLENLSDLFEKYAEELGMEGVRKIISSTKSTETNDSPDEADVGEQVVSIGIEIMKKISTIGKTDVKDFFADLIGVTSIEFGKMPINTPFIIIDQIRTAPEAEGFFMISSLASKVTKLLESPIELLKGWFDSTLEELKNDS